MSMMIRQRERDAIIKSLAAGVVPTIGLHHIQVDRKDEIMAMIADLERVREGGASIRFVIGRYGTGKSFFLNLTKSVAIAEKFVVMQADVAQKRRLASTTGYARNLYAELTGSMATKSRPDGGAIEVVLEKWILALRDKYGGAFDAQSVVRAELKPLQDMVGGYHFTAAAAKYCEACLAGDEGMLRSAKKWLVGGFDKLTEAKSEIAIDSFISDKDIYDYLKLWGAFVRIAGFSGLLILLDEMGVLAQALSNHVARTGNYEVILQILNDCLQGRTSGIGFLFAGADYFLDDRKNGLMSHGALASRLAPNPFARNGLKDFSTPVIRLGDFSPEDLYLLLENIREVFAMGDKSKYLVPDEGLQSFMNLCAWSLGPEFYKTPRDAVKLFTGFLSVLEQNAQVGWQGLLDGTVIEKSEEEPTVEPVFDDENLIPEPMSESAYAPAAESVTHAEPEELPRLEIELEPETASEPIPPEPVPGELEPQTAELPGIPEMPEPEVAPEAESTSEVEPESIIALPPAESEPVIAGIEPEIDLEPEPVFEPEPEPVTEPEPEPAFELDLESDGEPDNGFGHVALAPETDAGDDVFDFGLESSLESAPDYDPELGPGPGLYIVESRPNVYDPDILYIMPDAGSSREVSLRLVKPEAARETVAVKEITNAAVSPDEEDMRIGHVMYGNENDLKIFLPNLISRNPLIGMERIPAGVHNDLVRMSGKILINAYNNYLPNGYEKMLLSVALINIAKRWPSDDEDAFWNFIGRQLGFEKEAHETLYGTMCNAVYETMKSNHRFFSQNPKTNKREFYSTIMVHALAPRESMFAWFDLLLDFYRENMRGIVTADDPAACCLVDVMKDMFEDAAPEDVVLKGRRSAMGTGTVTLLQKRTAYFKKLTCETLEKLHRLASGRRLVNSTYLDELLNCWFVKKTPLQVTCASPFAKTPGPTAIAAGCEAIRPRYEVADSNSVVLVIPSVRLRERMRDCYDAVLEVSCGSNSIREELDVYGDEFAWTVSETRITLARLSMFDSAGDMNIRVKILAGDRMIYDSRTSLYRDIIVFEGENEIPLRVMKKGIYSVFATSDREVLFDTSGDDRIIPAAAGQMRAVKFTDGFGVTVNGRIACSDYRNEAVRVVVSSDPCPNLSFMRRGDEYDVWAGEFGVRARIPSGRDLRAYSFKIGHKYYPLSDCKMETDGGVIECVLDVDGGMIEDYVLDVAVVERGTDERELYRRGFCVLRDLSVAFDRPYYFGDEHGGTVKIEAGPSVTEFGMGAGEYAFVPFGEGCFKVKVPVVSWRLEPRIVGFDAADGRTVWRENLTPGSRIVAVCPDEVGCKLKIGGGTVECERTDGGEAVFDLSGVLSADAFGREEEIVQVELLLESLDDISSRPLFQICLKETFEETPKFEMRDGTLSLKNPWAFVGPRGAKLEYSFSGRSGASYCVAAGESVISGECALPHGSYQYRVFSVPEGEPQPEDRHVIYAGSCILGDVDIFHFDNKLLEIRHIRAGFKEFFILPIYVENLEFVETRAKYDDGVAYPIYSGTCYYLNRDDEKVYFGDGFNPVRVVIINGRDICLYKNDGSKPYLIYESRHKIASVKPEAISGVVCYVPDFYEYEALEGN